MGPSAVRWATRRRTALIDRARGCKASLLVAVVLLTAGAGCGEGFQNQARAPIPLELSGVIRPKGITVSPQRFGAGPVLITVANQTDRAISLVLEGPAVRAEVGPVNPRDTATIQQTLAQGTFEVRAESNGRRIRQISPARLEVGRSRGASNERLLLP